MDLRVLKSFVTVSKLGNITRASERLFISQPALTRQIQELEKELGCKLLDRCSRNLSLTESGYLFLIRAEEMLALAERTKQELCEKGEFLRGIVRVGVVETVVMDLLTDLISEFGQNHKHVRFEIYSADGDDLRRSLDENKLDIAFLLEPVESAKYEKIHLPTKETWGLAVREQDVPADKTYLTHDEVASMPLILPRRYIVIDEITGWLGVPEQNLKIVAYHNIPSNALSMVEKGLGALLCVEGSFTNRGKPGIKFLPIHPKRVSGHVVVRKKNHNLSRAAEIFWESLSPSKE